MTDTAVISVDVDPITLSTEEFSLTRQDDT